MARLVADAAPRDRQFHESSWALQERDEALYLLAWRDGACVGNVTLLFRSRYDDVRRTLGDFPELNGLGTRRRGEGIGTALIREAERLAQQRGATQVGLAVTLDNPRARGLYERLGYRDWGHGGIVDRWTEYDERGNPLTDHADDCNYLTRLLLG